MLEDEARERLAGAIRRSVVPHLAAVEAELTTGPNSDHHLPGQLEPLIHATERAQQELRTICRGVFPALLDRRGLVPALSAQLDVTHPHAQLDVDDTDGRRLDRAVEAAGYLFCVEVAPTDHSSVIKLLVEEDQLVATVTGDIDWANETSGSDGEDRAHSLATLPRSGGRIKRCGEPEAQWVRHDSHRRDAADLSPCTPSP